ncbi:hypothetical protein HDU98_008241 [Podochytrium sp. JEL0797]|nr:hypothetical protein HDU98_008241 [Podochytrium sp. JEL0797]
MRLSQLVVLVSLSLLAPVDAFDMVLNNVGNTFTYFQVTLKVPPLPIRPPLGTQATYFLWPGIQPGFVSNNVNFMPIGNGVLQPVLSFGPSCIPNVSPTLDYYSTWIISGLYVNLGGQPTGQVCNGGPILQVPPGDALTLTLQLDTSTGTWLQTIASATLGNSVTYSINLGNQSQGRAELHVELYNSATQYFPVEFSSITLRVSQAGDSAFCFGKGNLATDMIKKGETCGTGVVGADGVTCTVDKCVFAPDAPAPEGVNVPVVSSGAVSNLQSTSAAAATAAASGSVSTVAGGSVVTEGVPVATGSAGSSGVITQGGAVAFAGGVGTGNGNGASKSSGADIIGGTMAWLGVLAVALGV